MWYYDTISKQQDIINIWEFMEYQYEAAQIIVIFASIFVTWLN